MQNDIIEYIEKRLSEQKYSSQWVKLDGDTIPADMDYVLEWWNNCMKPELEAKSEE